MKRRKFFRNVGIGLFGALIPFNIKSETMPPLRTITIPKLEDDLIEKNRKKLLEWFNKHHHHLGENPPPPISMRIHEDDLKPHVKDIRLNIDYGGCTYEEALKMSSEKWRRHSYFGRWSE